MRLLTLAISITLSTTWFLFDPTFCFAHVVKGSETHLPPEDPGDIQVIEGNWDEPESASRPRATPQKKTQADIKPVKPSTPHATPEKQTPSNSKADVLNKETP